MRLSPEMLRSIHDLLRLKAGWNGTQSLPICPAALSLALDLIEAAKKNTGIDHWTLVPTVDGGVQIEDLVGSDIEIEVSPVCAFCDCPACKAWKRAKK